MMRCRSISACFSRCWGDASLRPSSTSVPTLEAPDQLTPEAELLDMGIVILDPGISAVEDEELVSTWSARRKPLYGDRTRQSAH